LAPHKFVTYLLT